MSRQVHIGLALAAALFAAGCSEHAEPPEAVPGVAAADTVLINGGIYTVAPDRGWAESLAVRDGVIVEVGDNEAVGALIGPDTRVIDLSGRMALPGFHDAHVHPTMGGFALLGCNLIGEGLRDLLDPHGAERSPG